MSATLTIQNCKNCRNSGITFRANGSDDTDAEYCTCFYGQQKEMLDDEEIADAEDDYEDYSNSNREAYGL